MDIVVVLRSGHSVRHLEVLSWVKMVRVIQGVLELQVVGMRLVERARIVMRHIR